VEDKIPLETSACEHSRSASLDHTKLTYPYLGGISLTDVGGKTDLMEK